jgi:hypothetical protein
MDYTTFGRKCSTEHPRANGKELEVFVNNTEVVLTVLIMCGIIGVVMEYWLLFKE